MLFSERKITILLMKTKLHAIDARHIHQQVKDC